MAVQEQLDILQQGSKVWNTWRVKQPGADIDLTGANLSNVKLTGANLASANLTGANLSHVDLTGAKFTNANLTKANLTYADLTGANLASANLIRANLSYANLSYVNLTKTNFTDAIIGFTTFGNVDLSTIEGLETVEHRFPSIIGIDAIYQSHGEIPEVFLRGTGVQESFIKVIKSIVSQPTKYYSCFISYSGKDKKFADRLHADLRDKGVPCWFAPHSLKIGADFPSHIEEAIWKYDKLLVIISQASVKSEWVGDEVRAALEKEARLRKDQQQEKNVLLPIKIDATIEHTLTQWAAKLRRARHVGDFQCWNDDNAYQLAFERLLQDLKTDPKDIQGNMP